MLILEYPLQYLMYSQTRPSIKKFISNSKLFVLLSFNSFLQMVINLSHFCEPGKPLISTELADFIENSANDFHPNEKLSLNIYSNCITDDEKVIYNQAIKNYFQLQLKDVIRSLKQKRIIAISFSIVGIIALAFMFICSNMGIKQIWIECINIFAWVFIWEAVDLLFIEQNSLLIRRKRLINFIEMSINYHNTH